jgi:hypothetical protein
LLFKFFVHSRQACTQLSHLLPCVATATHSTALGWPGLTARAPRSRRRWADPSDPVEGPALAAGYRCLLESLPPAAAAAGTLSPEAFYAALRDIAAAWAAGWPPPPPPERRKRRAPGATSRREVWPAFADRDWSRHAAAAAADSPVKDYPVEPAGSAVTPETDESPADSEAWPGPAQAEPAWTERAWPEPARPEQWNRAWICPADAAGIAAAGGGCPDLAWTSAARDAASAAAGGGGGYSGAVDGGWGCASTNIAAAAAAAAVAAGYGDGGWTCAATDDECAALEAEFAAGGGGGGARWAPAGPHSFGPCDDGPAGASRRPGWGGVYCVTRPRPSRWEFVAPPSPPPPPPPPPGIRPVREDGDYPLYC